MPSRGRDRLVVGLVVVVWSMLILVANVSASTFHDLPCRWNEKLFKFECDKDFWNEKLREQQQHSNKVVPGQLEKYQILYDDLVKRLRSVPMLLRRPPPPPPSLMPAKAKKQDENLGNVLNLLKQVQECIRLTEGIRFRRTMLGEMKRGDSRHRIRSINNVCQI